MAGPFVIAVTGGAGAGKTTAAGFFAARGGVVVLAADDYARRFLEDPAVVDGLVRSFGAGILDEAGAIDRKALADIAFASAGALARLDAVMHPSIVRAMIADLDALVAAESPPQFAVLDVPLLASVPAVLSRCDAVVALEAPVDVRVRRLESRGLTPADSLRRITLQPSDADRRALATDVVVNDGSSEDLAARLGPLWDDLAERAAAR